MSRLFEVWHEAYDGRYQLVRLSIWRFSWWEVWDWGLYPARQEEELFRQFYRGRSSIERYQSLLFYARCVYTGVNREKAKQAWRSPNKNH